MQEAHFTAEILDQARSLSRWYLKKFDLARMQETFSVDGKKLNSAYWLVGHIAWAENNIVLKSTGGPNPELKWLKMFRLGSDGSIPENAPDYKTIRKGFDHVHKLSLEHIRSLTQEDWDKPLTFDFLGMKTQGQLIKHAIRHENFHTGQLAWILKMQGVPTI